MQAGQTVALWLGWYPNPSTRGLTWLQKIASSVRFCILWLEILASVTLVDSRVSVVVGFNLFPTMPSETHLSLPVLCLSNPNSAHIWCLLLIPTCPHSSWEIYFLFSGRPLLLSFKPSLLLSLFGSVDLAWLSFYIKFHCASLCMIQTWFIRTFFCTEFIKAHSTQFPFTILCSPVLLVPFVPVDYIASVFMSYMRVDFIYPCRI